MMFIRNTVVDACGGWLSWLTVTDDGVCYELNWDISVV